jgi:putative transposase
MRFAFIEQHVDTFPVRLMCRVLEVSPSGFYAWRSRPESARTARDRHLLAKVRRLQVQHHGRYGSPRMHAALRAEGHGCSRGRVERLMRRHDIRALAGRRFRPCTTDSRHSLPVAPNLLAQRFVAPAPNRVWLADITLRPAMAGYTWRPSSISRRARSSAGQCGITCGPNWRSRRC